MKTLFITLVCCIYTISAFSQGARFMVSGSVVFEKTVNIYGLIKQHMGKNPDNNTLEAFDKYKETHPQFKKFTSTLLFNNSESLYLPSPSVQESILGDNNPMVTAGNTTYFNVSSGMGITQKQIYDDIYLVKDTARVIKWRYTGETREIAGYTCRRANAIVMDSIYVVAFYTDQIHFSGGPESFLGLPGMILGIALPYENVTWFATSVTDTSVEPNSIKPPQKGNPVTRRQLTEILKKKMDTWGAVGKFEQKVFSL